MQNPKAKLMQMLKGKFSEKQLAEYAEEAENQEGAQYWQQFKNAEELAKDISLYIANSE